MYPLLSIHPVREWNYTLTYEYSRPGWAFSFLAGRIMVWTTPLAKNSIYMTSAAGRWLSTIKLNSSTLLGDQNPSEAEGTEKRPGTEIDQSWAR
jgi:hypothetical protein